MEASRSGRMGASRAGETRGRGSICAPQVGEGQAGVRGPRDARREWPTGATGQLPALGNRIGQIRLRTGIRADSRGVERVAPARASGKHQPRPALVPGCPRPLSSQTTRQSNKQIDSAHTQNQGSSKPLRARIHHSASYSRLKSRLPRRTPHTPLPRPRHPTLATSQDTAPSASATLRRRAPALAPAHRRLSCPARPRTQLRPSAPTPTPPSPTPRPAPPSRSIDDALCSCKKRTQLAHTPF